jgi:hypothetical protein
MDEQERMNRRRFVELAPWHANGTLSEADRAWVDAYASEHPEARAELEWYGSLQRSVRANAPEVSAEIGFDRLRDRIRLENRRAASRRHAGALDRLLAPLRDGLASLFVRPAYAYAAAGLVVVQAGVIGALFVEQQRTEREYAEYRSIATTPAATPLLRVSFRQEAREVDIRNALVDVGGTLVGGPGQLGEYLVRVAPNRLDSAAATLRGNPAVESVEVSAPPAAR